MSAAPLELVTSPGTYNLEQPPAQFVVATAEAVTLGGVEGQGPEKGTVLGDDQFVPAYPVVVQAVPVPVPDGGASAVPMQAVVPEGETMARV